MNDGPDGQLERIQALEKAVAFLMECENARIAQATKVHVANEELNNAAENLSQAKKH